MPQLFTFETRDAVTIRDGILRVIRNGLVRRGVANPNVTPGSDWYVFAQGVANELAVVEANAIIKADEQMPDSADGDALVRLAAIYGLSLQSAFGASGYGALSSTAATTILANAELTDANGLRYKLSVGGTYSNGDPLPIEAIDTGAATNHSAGDVLRWHTAPPFSDEKVVIGAGGLVNGHDAEDIEGLRSRLFARLRNPPRSGNWGHVADIAEQSSPAVQKAFVYPAIQGPATLHVAVTATPTLLNKNRDVAAATVAGIVSPFVAGQLPEHAYVLTTTVANVATEVAILLSIPDAATASPPGPGGGWLDGSPWPDVGAAASGCRVTSVTSSLVLVVNATVAPTVGVSRVSWLSATDWAVRTARVVAVSGTSGAYTITLDSPFAGIVANDLLWPACANAQAYVNTVLASFALMGPGEKSANASALIRGYRHPRPVTLWPYGIGAQMLRDLVHSQQEIASAQYLYRTDGTTINATTGGTLNPQVPGAVASPPNILTPNRFGFYRPT